MCFRIPAADFAWWVLGDVYDYARVAVLDVLDVVRVVCLSSGPVRLVALRNPTTVTRLQSRTLSRACIKVEQQQTEKQRIVLVCLFVWSSVWSVIRGLDFQV